MANPLSEYSHPCPACGALIDPSLRPRSAKFICPNCGAHLKYDYKYTFDLLIISVVSAIVLARFLGFRGLAFVLITVCLTLTLWALGFFLVGIVYPPGFKRMQDGDPYNSKPFDKALTLHFEEEKDRTDDGNKADPESNSGTRGTGDPGLK
jgi:hypothetical protein